MKLIAIALVICATSPALAGLALEVEVENEEVGFRAPVAFVVRFVNRGTSEVSYFEPLHTGLITFPDIRLVRRGDGRELRPADPPFQSMVSRGLQGAIVRLTPGESKAYRHVRARFLAHDLRSQKSDWREPRPLPDGEYEIRATYERPDDRLPHLGQGIAGETRRVAGIFVGTIRASPATFRVRPPTRPHVRISAPDRGRTEIVITFSNPTAEAYVFTGAARFDLGSKMYGSAVAPGVDAALTVPVPPRGTAERRVDLRELGWRRVGTKVESPEGLGSIVPEGVCHLQFLLEGDAPAASDGIWVNIPPVPQRGLEDVAVTAAILSPARVGAGQPVRLAVNVENLGEGDVGLVHRLAFPRELVIRIEDADGLRPSIVSTTGTASHRLDGFRPRGESACRIAKGLSWDRDRFEPAPALTRRDFVWLEPQAGILREIELTGLLATGLTPGRYRIAAGYRNLETGAHLGFGAGRGPGTGTVWSEPVTLTVR